MLIEKFFPFLKSSTKNTTKTKVKTQKEIDASIMDKNERVNTKWNKFKNIFGCGETLTPQEERRLENIKIQDRIKQMHKQHNQTNGSVFTDDSW